MTNIIPQFVEFIPNSLNDGVFYVSQKYNTVAHKCCCGCGTKIVTPITPTDWSLTIVKDAITLNPSIGNWSYPCKSHYWIRDNKVIWAGSMTEQQINQGRAYDRERKKAYFEKAKPQITSSSIPLKPTTQSLLSRLVNWLKSMF